MPTVTTGWARPSFAGTKVSTTKSDRHRDAHERGPHRRCRWGPLRSRTSQRDAATGVDGRLPDLDRQGRVVPVLLVDVERLAVTPEDAACELVLTRMAGLRARRGTHVGRLVAA